MARYQRKVTIVEAVQYHGKGLVVMNDKGEQQAKTGDWLVGDEPGKIEVYAQDEFARLFAPVMDEPVVETHGEEQ